jgi:osmotically-inducible protein OsmY
MKIRNALLATGLVLSVGIVMVASPARGASARQQVAAAILVEDDALKARVAANLKDSSSLAPRNIDVVVKQGVVTLSGKVRNASEKTRAGELATMSGVTSVNNVLEIDPQIDQSKTEAAAEKSKTGVNKAVDATASATVKTKEAVQKGTAKAEQGLGKAADKTSSAIGKSGDKLGDTSVTTRVKAGFSSDKLLEDTAIDIVTTDRVVTLKGTVASIAAKERAAEIAGGIEGVTRVVNLLLVKAT